MSLQVVVLVNGIEEAALSDGHENGELRNTCSWFIVTIAVITINSIAIITINILAIVTINTYIYLFLYVYSCLFLIIVQCG